MKLLRPNRVTGAYVYRIVALAIGLVLMARLLPPSGYGTLAAVGGLVGLATPFAGLGYGNLLVRSASTGSAGGWARLMLTYRIMVLMAAPLIVAVSLISGWVFSGHTGLIVLLTCATELGSLSVVNLAASVLLALGDRTRYSFWLAIPSTVRLLVIAAMFLMPHHYHSATVLCLLYLAATIPVAVTAHHSVARGLRNGITNVSEQGLEPWHAGISFSVGLATRTVYEDIDKVMLAHYRGFGETGIYAAAYRVVQAAASPALAANAEMYPRFFQARHSPLEMRGLTKTVLARTTAWSAAAFGGLLLVSPVAAWALGPAYGDAGRVIRLLAFLPLLMSVHFVLGDAITGMGRQAARASTQIGSAFINVVMNAVLIPKWGIEGAVLSTATSEALLCVALFGIWRAAVRHPEPLAS